MPSAFIPRFIFTAARANSTKKITNGKNDYAIFSTKTANKECDAKIVHSLHSGNVWGPIKGTLFTI